VFILYFSSPLLPLPTQAPHSVEVSCRSTLLLWPASVGHFAVQGRGFVFSRRKGLISLVLSILSSREFHILTFNWYGPSLRQTQPPSQVSDTGITTGGPCCIHVPLFLPPLSFVPPSNPSDSLFFKIPEAPLLEASILKKAKIATLFFRLPFFFPWFS